MFKDSQGKWHHTEEENRKTGKAQKGKYVSEETRQKLGKALKGRTVWNKGTRGVMKPNRTSFKKGNRLSEETKLKMSKTMKGRVITWGDKISEATKGHEVSEETRLKISEAGKGHIPWNKGIEREEYLEIMGDVIGRPFKKGSIPWNKSKINVYSEETLRAIGDAGRGRKHTEETKRKMSENNGRENHWNWQGGKSFEPYSIEFNKQLKELIRNRDNYQCQKCGCPEVENIEKLSIHHIDYDKKNCLPSNLISLCRSCNAVVNNDREYWEDWFNQKMEVKLEDRVTS